MMQYKSKKISVCYMLFYWFFLNTVIAQVAENLGPNVNSRFAEICPIVSPDGKILYFSRTDNSNIAAPQFAYFSYIDEKGNFSKAVEFPRLVKDALVYNLYSISADNKRALFVIYSKEYQGLYFLYRNNNEWSKPSPLRIKNLSKYSSVPFLNASLSLSGKILFLSFGRRESNYIMFEIYVSFLQSDSSWTEPVSIGKPVNSEFVDNTIHYGGSFVPFLSSDETTLYFSSFRKDSYGECDIYMSRRTDTTFLKWSEPINLGEDINSAGWDAYFSISAKGDYAYFVSDKNSYGQEDIMRIKIIDALKPKPVVLVYGSVFEEKTLQLINATVEYQQVGNPNSLKKLNLTPENSIYKVFLNPGYQYLFIATSPYHLTKSIILDLKNVTYYKEQKLDFFLPLIDTQKVYILENILFDFDKAELKPESFSELNKITKFLLENPELRIEIRGHTDNIGTKEYNLQLSLARAEAVANYLTEKGIDRKRIEVFGFGEEQPVAPNDTEGNRQKNRRVEFKLK
ncbi:MAG: OmpA family protein [Ignavibacteria bacterium]